jgi:glycogen synthase
VDRAAHLRQSSGQFRAGDLNVRILVISNLFPPRIRGGYELACFNISAALRSRGHEVRVLTTDTTLPLDDQEEEFVDRSLDMRRFREIAATSRSVDLFIEHESRVANLHNTSELLRVLREFRPDHVVPFNLLGIGGLALLDLLNSVGAPWTLNLGDRIPFMMLDATIPAVANVFGALGGASYSTGQVAAISQTVVDEIQRDGVDMGPNVRIISRGVLPHDIPRTRAFRDGGVTKFVSGGTVNEQKGIGLILDCARALLDRGLGGRFTIDIYGDGMVTEFAHLSRTIGVSDVVTFHGPVSQERLLQAEVDADVFLFPTWEREPLGNAPIEAASVGCVPIMTASCGAAERLVNGIHAIKVPRYVEDFTDAMADVITGITDLESMSVAGIRITREALSMAHAAVLLEEFIQEGSRPGWQDERLDDPAVGEEVLTKDTAALALLYEFIQNVDGARAEDFFRIRGLSEGAVRE